MVERSQGLGATAHAGNHNPDELCSPSLLPALSHGASLCSSESLFDEFLQLSDAGGFLLGRGRAQREGAAAVPAGGRRGQAQAEKVQHAALLTPLQALREQGTAFTHLGAAAAQPSSNLHLLFAHQELHKELWVTLSSEQE